MGGTDIEQSKREKEKEKLSKDPHYAKYYVNIFVNKRMKK